MAPRQVVVAPRPVRVGLAVVYAGSVLVASVVDPSASGVALTATGPLGLVGLDKWFHLVTYGGLAGVCLYAALARTRRALVGTLLVAVAYGAGIELLQAFLPARSFSVADATANAAGASLVVGGWALVLWYRRRRSARHARAR